MSVAKRENAIKYDVGHPRSVISYIGGKFALCEQIIAVIEYAARTYSLDSFYETCGGGARTLLNLPVSLFKHRVYSEIHLGLCNLFACLGMKPDVYELMALLEDLGVGEDVFLRARHALEYETRMISMGHSYRLGGVESAAFTFIQCMQSRAADMTSTFDSSRLSDKRRLRSYFKRVRELDRFYPILADVQVINGDVIELLDLIAEGSSAFAYIDPPYAPDCTIINKHYGDRSWTMADHERLVDRLMGIQAKVALSGYNSFIYDRLVEAGWRKLYLRRLYVSSSASVGRYNEEYLWINFDIPASLEDQVSWFDYGSV
ncbi:DNA adenine methylase [Brevibacillus humidisoli]|uniref:DNA adenine methylase n=1 Tax=Brevibacillus humidisoli TaxID=2895522 RepID=UPI001E56E9C4|nr:DNA adenine methylase [Brevibacillus humidisoli]UFJ40399.1 DNA adenine methylase [Brevibacillus humidisoli]